MYGKIFAKGIGYYFFAELLCIFLVFSLGLIGNVFFRILSGVCCLGILICLIINFTINCQKEIKLSAADNGSKPVIISSLSASLVYFILYILLAAAKCGFLPDNFYRIYKLLNAPTMAVLNLISSDITASSISVPGFIAMFFISLIPALTVTVTYIMCRKGVIPEDFIFQKK